MEPERRLEVARKIVSAAGDHGIAPEDVLIDPLAMPVGAEPRAVTLFLETLHLLRDELGVNTTRSEEHTSELQSQSNLVCRLLLEKKKIIYDYRSMCINEQCYYS